MELRDLKTFVAVASLLSFNQAGRALNAAQSTVSARIQALEEELGLRLFDRLGRKVLLTEAGERLLDYAKKITDLEDEARAWVAGDEKARGALTIRIPESLSVHRLPGMFMRFRRKFPNVRVRFMACAYDGLAADLRKGVIDLAFLLAQEVRAGDLLVECLGVERLAMVAAPGHRLAARATVGYADLDRETVLLATSDCSYRRILERTLAEEGVSPVVGVEFSSVASLKRHVAEGAGFTVLPEIAARQEIDTGAFKELAWSEGELEAAVLMLCHKDKWVSPALAGFMDLARRHLMTG
ncbi:MAG: LysR family transcriptional regulator [Acidobacteriota bacterium]